MEVVFFFLIFVGEGVPQFLHNIKENETFLQEVVSNKQELHHDKLLLYEGKIDGDNHHNHKVYTSFNHKKYIRFKHKVYIHFILFIKVYILII